MENETKNDQMVEEELAAYEKLRLRLSRTLGELTDKINSDSVSQAMEKALADLKGIGEHSKDLLAGVGKTLQKDIASSLGQIKPKVDANLEETRKDFTRLQNKGGALWRDLANEADYLKKLSLDKGGAFLLEATRGLSEWTRGLGDKLDKALSYKTGEITHGGEFTCTSCGAEVHLKKPGRLPPCPKCSKTGFRRS